MTIHFEIPKDIEEQLPAAGIDPTPISTRSERRSPAEEAPAGNRQ